MNRPKRQLFAAQTLTLNPEDISDTDAASDAASDAALLRDAAEHGPDEAVADQFEEADLIEPDYSVEALEAQFDSSDSTDQRDTDQTPSSESRSHRAQVSLLLICRDPQFRADLEAQLNMMPCEIVTAKSVNHAVRLVAKRELDLVITETHLGSSDSVEMRNLLVDQHGVDAPIVAVARETLVNVVARNLRGGMTDVITGPHLVQPIFALRIQNILRMTGRVLSPAAESSLEPALTAGALTLWPWRYQIACNGEIEAISSREMCLLRMLMEHPGNVVTRQAISNRLAASNEQADDRAVENLVYRIRKKISETDAEIKTVRGVGYCLEV